MNALNSTRAATAPVMRPQPLSPDMRLLDRLPRRSSLELGAYKTAPGSARAHLANVLREWLLPEFEDVALLIATELITNAVLAADTVAWPDRRPPVRMWLRGGPATLAILIWDFIPAAPVPRAAGDDEESGRGLGIVATLSAECGFYYPERIGGKVTWALIKSP